MATSPKARKHGLTIDSMLAAEVVTAERQLLYVDDANLPDLFWALRGGGGNFGVVTRIKLQSHEVDTVVGGIMLLPATADVIERFIHLAEEAPEELSTILNVMPAPPTPFLPDTCRERGSRIMTSVAAFHGGPVNIDERRTWVSDLSTALEESRRLSPAFFGRAMGPITTESPKNGRRVTPVHTSTSSLTWTTPWSAAPIRARPGNGSWKSSAVTIQPVSGQPQRPASLTGHPRLEQ